MDVVRGICDTVGWQCHQVYLPQALPFGYHLKEPFKTRLADGWAKIEGKTFDFLSHGNADRSLLEILGTDYRAFHVIRDPRDIVVSGYFSHRYSHPASAQHNPWLLEHRAALAELDQLEGLQRELEFCAVYFDRLANWDYTNPRVYECRFEELTVDPQAEFRKILAFLQVTVPEGRLLPRLQHFARRVRRRIRRRKMRAAVCPGILLDSIIDAKSFERTTGGRAKGTEKTDSHYRKGLSGDWKNYFTPKLKKEFKDRYGELLIDLGYARDLRW
jgi:hypothetical protein